MAAGAKPYRFLTRGCPHIAAMESRLDPASRQLLQIFLRKVMFLLLIAVGFSLLAPAALACTLLQAQAVISGAMSIALGIAARHRVDGPSLTYWDEAMAFTAIGLLGHIGTHAFA